MSRFFFVYFTFKYLKDFLYIYNSIYIMKVIIQTWHLFTRTCFNGLNGTTIKGSNQFFTTHTTTLFNTHITSFFKTHTTSTSFYNNLFLFTLSFPLSSLVFFIVFTISTIFTKSFNFPTANFPPPSKDLFGLLTPN